MASMHRPSAPRIASLAWRCLAAAAVLLACESASGLAAKKHGSADAAPGMTARLSAEARVLADWIVAANDSRGRPFLIVDKRQATVSAFDAAGRPLASAPALLGLARGDDSVPGIGERRIADIHPHERTTPAGRFAAELGTNTGGEDILWVDYDDAISMHRVRPVKASERRLQRLASPTPDEATPTPRPVIVAPEGFVYGVNFYTDRVGPALADFPANTGLDAPLLVSEYAPAGMSRAHLVRGDR